MADMAQRLNLLILSPLLTSSNLLRRCRYCFSLQPPPQRLLLPALALLETAGATWRVVYISDTDLLSQETCGALVNLTRARVPATAQAWEVLEWPMDLDHIAGPVPRAQGVEDVWMLCTQRFQHCLNFLEFWSTLNASQSPSALVISAPCVSMLHSVPNYGGFILGVLPLNFWAAWTSTAVDESWSNSGMTAEDLLPWFSSLVKGADLQEIQLQVRQYDNETLGSFQRLAEIGTLRAGRPLGPLSTWASLSTLLTAMERVDQVHPEAVSSFFRAADLSTIAGPMNFDTDGALLHGAWVLQLLPLDPVPKLLSFAMEGVVCTLSSSCEISNRLNGSVGSVVQTLSDPVVPLPAPEHRACFMSGSSTWGFEVLPHGSFCVPCVEHKVWIFDQQQHRRFCRSCAASEYVVDFNNGTRSCLPCASGTASCNAGYYPLNCECQECSPGTFGINGSCSECPAGRFSSWGASSCDLCPVGQSSQVAAATCVNCSAGTFSSADGDLCTACPPGRAAPQAGMTECLVCGAGRRSTWDGVFCQECPKGSYQPSSNSSECLAAVEGADFNHPGLVTGINRDGYWTRQMASKVIWEPCIAPQQCLSNETCAAGSAGVQCFSCLPGHVRGSAGCRNCNGLEAAVGLGAFALLVVIFSVLLAKLGLARYIRPKDLRLVYIKIFLLYLVIADALFETAMEALRRRPTVSWLSQLLPPAASPQLLRLARCAADVAGRRLGRVPLSAAEALVGPAVSRSMVEILVPGSDLLELVDAPWQTFSSLSVLPHGSWFLPETLPQHEQLKAYQFTVELFSLCFWCFLPWILWLFLYICSLCYVRLQLWRQRDFFRRSSCFYEELVKDGTRETLACYDAQDWLSFCKAYFETTCYLWSSLKLFEAADLGGCCWFLKAFREQARPLLIALLLVIYAPVLMGLVEAFRCLCLGDESELRHFYAPELKCGDVARPYTWIHWSCTFLWALGVPCFLSNMLRKVRNSLPDDFEFPPDYAVTSFGYRLSCWNWEMYLFFLKAVIIFSVLLGPAGRSSFLFFLAILHGVLTRAMNPFTGRSHFALVKWDQRFALFFVGGSILVQGLRFSSNVEIVNQILASGMVVLLLLVNLMLVLLLLWDSFDCWHETFVESYEFYEWEIWHQSHGTFGIRRRLVSILLNQYKRRVRGRAYVSFDVRLGWLTVCGSHGDQARCTFNWREDGIPCELSEAPLETPSGVRPSTVAQRAQVQKYLQKAAERLCLIRGAPSFSVVELEFLIRVSFVFARRQELRRSRLTKQRQLISKEESFLGLDALQLLWNSLEEGEEEEEAARGTRGSTFAKARRLDLGSDVASRTSSYQPLSAKIRKRFQAEKICESFFNDPGKVLFFYSRAEFIRQAEIKKMKGEVAHRMSSIPSERTAAFSLCCSLLRHVCNACRRLCRCCTRTHDLSVASERSSVFRGGAGRGMKSHVIRGVEQVDPIIQEMFDDETFSRGLELQEFQMGLIVVEHTKDFELKALQDAFHDRWFQHRLLVEHQMRKQQGALKDQSVQADADEDMSEQLAQESLEAKMTDEDRPTVEDLRWMRLVMKAGGGLFKEKVMPSLAEINRLLRERRSQDLSSQGSSEAPQVQSSLTIRLGSPPGETQRSIS